ncbi:DUF6895 family protein [Streptomyces sp. t39]|uniref:DUF6895 family protein n=1 Tax=Streptomyces sp. t39 TaxID=1828156 RepID=UPI0011CDE2BD|nr:hypothetical protein [Streptomyces sp. t39]TXS52126.1 hypothetical protein EAO77_21460 [Streptomyces sp. t39]
MSAAGIRALADSALGWVSENRDDFRLGEDALAPEADVNRSWKPLGELAQVCVTVQARTAPGTALHERAGRLLAFAWEQTREGALLLDLQRLEPAATYPLEIYAAFASAGLRHPGYDSYAALLAGTRSWRLTEQQPNRRLGLLNSARRCGLPVPDDAGAVLRRTWLGGLPEPWTFERAAGYTLTHVVFHLTDWGHDIGAVPDDVVAYLDDWLPPWLDTCLEDEQWDLSCELLAVAAALPSVPDPGMLSGAFAELSGVQDASGAIPEVGPGRTGRPVRRDFAGTYHSTLMAVFASALALARSGSPERPEVPS